MKKLIALLLAALMIVALAACDGTADSDVTPAETAAETAAEPAAESDLAYVQEKGTLIVGITDFAPMDYRNEDGEWIGFDADMAKSFADALGVAVEFVEIEWDNKTAALDDKTIDCVWNGMTMTEESAAAMECSKAYCNNAQVVVVPAKDADKYQSVADCRDLKFAVEIDSAGELEAGKLGFDVTPVKSQTEALKKVASKAVDAAVVDLIMASASVGPETAYADLTFTVQLNSEACVIGFRKGSDLADKLNIFFATAYADGFMQRVAETYGVQAALIPQAV